VIVTHAGAGKELDIGFIIFMDKSIELLLSHCLPPEVSAARRLANLYCEHFWMKKPFKRKRQSAEASGAWEVSANFSVRR
jgi:hypothetical protein